jgi:hypothetical protein
MVVGAIMLASGCGASSVPISHRRDSSNLGETTSSAAVDPSGQAPALVSLDSGMKATEKLVVEVDLFAAQTLKSMVQREERLTLAAAAFGQNASTCAELKNVTGFRAIVEAIEEHLAKLQRADARAGTSMADSHRLFDRSWLRSPAAFFELVAVVNRLDRYPFAREHCGETRLIYRLAYRQEFGETSQASRLPMTVNLVYWQDVDDDASTCASVARRWMHDPSQLPDEEWWLREESPLAPARLARSQLKALEINLQTLRWPSVTHPSLGGHAEYLLRVFHPRGESYVAAALENTPDLSALMAQEALRDGLAQWLMAPEQRAALHDATLVIPDKYLANEAISVTPRGLGRLANRPYSLLFAARDFSNASWSPLVERKAESLRRLDALSCQGCHESRSVAGFHVVGENEAVQETDAIALPASPHYYADRERRLRVVRELARGESPTELRQHAEVSAKPGVWGERCGLGDFFPDVTCAPGLKCTQLDDEQVGVCLGDEPSRQVGDPCEFGPLKTYAQAIRDRAKRTETRFCGADMVCNANDVGFPLGMCTASCASQQKEGACGAIVELRPFNQCLARRQPFAQCIASAQHPAGLRICSVAKPCRDDYICARVGATGKENAVRHGVCIPPYFLFQLRVDGHQLESL